MVLHLNGRISIYVVVDVAHYNISYDFQVNIISWLSILQYFYNETITTSLATSLYMVKGHYVCK